MSQDSGVWVDMTQGAKVENQKVERSVRGQEGVSRTGNKDSFSQGINAMDCSNSSASAMFQHKGLPSPTS